MSSSSSSCDPTLVGQFKAFHDNVVDLYKQSLQQCTTDEETIEFISDKRFPDLDRDFIEIKKNIKDANTDRILSDTGIDRLQERWKVGYSEEISKIRSEHETLFKTSKCDTHALDAFLAFVAGVASAFHIMNTYCNGFPSSMTDLLIGIIDPLDAAWTLIKATIVLDLQNSESRASTPINATPKKKRMSPLPPKLYLK